MEVTNTSRVKDLEQIYPPMKKQKKEDTRAFETEISKSYQQKDFFCEICHLQFDKKAVFDIHNSFLHKSKNDIENVPKGNEKSYQGLSERLEIIEKPLCSNNLNQQLDNEESKCIENDTLNLCK